MEKRALQDRLLAVGLAIAGMTIAMLVVYVGTGLLDGFDDWDLHRLGRRFRRYFPYALLLAAGLGLLLHSYYSALIRATPAPWTMLITIPRAFIHFASLGFVLLFALMALLASECYKWIVRKLRGANDPKDLAEDRVFHNPILLTGIAVPLWFILFPISTMQDGVAGEKDDDAGEKDDDLERAEDVSRSPRRPGINNMKHRMLLLLPWLVASALLWVGGESEATWNRVDPYWLTVFASFWFADYLVVAFRVLAMLPGRRGAAP
jgi:hypothetical protein